MPLHIVCVGLALLSFAHAQLVMPIGTLAGDGQAGFGGDGGPAAKARLNAPFAVLYDGAGNVVFSDTGNHRIRRIDMASGAIETLAGTGEAGFSGDGGPAVSARLNEPYGLAIDARGNIYFADRLNRRVRRIDAQSGLITTVAGNGSSQTSGDGRQAIQAGLVEPNDVALDGRGRLYVADVGANRVRLVHIATGVIHTYAGTGEAAHGGDGGPHASARLFGPRAIEVAPSGTVLILEREGNSLRAVSPVDGTITTIAGTGAKGYSGDGGPASEATFNGPKEMTIDRQGQILIVDTENHAIRRIDAETGQVSTIAGTGKAGFSGEGADATRAQLSRPHGVAIGPDGSIVIGDTGNNRLRFMGVVP